jgi:plasmid maintenance system antidote protein VapI
MTVTSQLKMAVQDAEETLYRVAKSSGVSYATLHSFMKGRRSLSADAIDKLCTYFGFKLTR